MEWTYEVPKEEGDWYVFVGNADNYLYNLSSYGQILKYGRSLYLATQSTNYLLTRLKGQWLGPLPWKPSYLNKAEAAP